MNRVEAMKKDRMFGFYCEWDEETASYGVFGSSTGFMYSMHMDLSSGEEEAERMNEKVVGE